MRKVALVFLLAVLLPSLALAWLAARSLRDQQLVLERQQFMLSQGLADATAGKIAARLAELQGEFGSRVEALLGSRAPEAVAPVFDQEIVRAWPLAQVGFAVSLKGEVLAPSLVGSKEARQFRLENDKFLSNRESVEVYWNSPKGVVNLSQLNRGKALAGAFEQPALPGKSQTKNQLRNVLPQQQEFATQALVIDPPGSNEQQISKAVATEAEFRHVVGDAQEGSVARFLQDRLHLLFWYRSARDPNLVFGAQVHPARLLEELRPLVEDQAGAQPGWGLALLNESGKPDARWPAALNADWKRPFVATEIGDVLPHWEVGVYLLDPAASVRAAETLKLTLGLLIAILVVAIATGSWLIFADMRRQLRVAQQKTDFVSNVSHELKTPLTSIRMFSELLADGRITDDGKRRAYLQIISTETARLTRLINGVLDFARMDRGERKYRYESFDLAELVRETLDTLQPQLEGAGFQIEHALPPAPVMVNADRDAIAQVLLNVLSNAEKYSMDRKDIRVELEALQGAVELRVLDRGSGVPTGCEKRIFEQFYRGHDSLDSGVQGSGLGLTLARQIARAHGGDLTYNARDGGGSCFTLHLK